MKLNGTLEVMPLPDLLQWISSAGKTGGLHLDHGKTSSRLYFRDGVIVGCSSDDPPMLLGQFLLFLGLITEEMLRDAMHVQRDAGGRLDAILLETGGLSSEELEHAVSRKALETMLGLFELDKGAFWFEDNQAPDRRAISCSFDVHDIAMRGVKRIDDVRRIRSVIPHPGIRPKLTGRLPSYDRFKEWSTRKVLVAVDGKRTVGEIVLQVHGTEFLVCEILLDLHDDGLVELPEAAEPPAGGGAPEPPSQDATKRVDESESEPARHPTVNQKIGPDNLAEIQNLAARGEFEEVFTRLDEAYDAQPNNPYLRQAMVDAEERFLAHLEDEGLSPAKLPMPLKSSADLEDTRTSPAQDQILSLSDGTWDLQSLMWVLPMRPVDVLSAVKDLVDRGIVDLLDPPDGETGAVEDESSAAG